ncbi:DUF2339 domain-containing protein [Muriicola soli]|uniref:DUF2339 domain-containing protein n=1 Tax=Muriicola soli TaxID=2507538 RepID=A0A411EC41_9FLAO|nr:DUF2339 domain-containing protein [Muriicola soli]QBA65315.1 DUF2339 domain-containing protein [Muriicola soli]
MENQQDQINRLTEKLELLRQVHSHFSEEIAGLKAEIEQLKKDNKINAPALKTSEKEAQSTVADIPKETADTVGKEISEKKYYRKRQNKILGGVCSGIAESTGMNLLLMRFLWVLFTLLFCIGAVVYLILWLSLPEKESKSPAFSDLPKVGLEKAEVLSRAGQDKTASDMEKYIGENIISKIGIAVLIIGVGIGAKYSIDNDLISPLIRILLGYLVGAGLLAVSFRLLRKYENFSAVLLSGAMAIFYFITYAAYAFYDLFPAYITFLMMVLFTVATVLAALRLNKQFIAHIGLVGAYAVPFLLSEGEGKALVLFSYMAIINGGILVVAFKKYWKPLYLVAFGLSWLIVISWGVGAYEAKEHFILALSFSTLFFLLFYATFLAYKILRKEVYNPLDIALVLANSFIFYGLGYGFLTSQVEGENYLGLFTLGNALLHLGVGFMVYRQKGIDKNIYFLISGMVLVFLTLSIPVELDGSWVTLLWLGEALVLFYIGKTKQVAIYEKLAYPLLLLSSISLLQDWVWAYGDTEELSLVFLNPTFLTSAIFCAVLGYMNLLYHNKKFPGAFAGDNGKWQLLSTGLASLLLLSLYASVALEINYYWERQFQASATGEFGIGGSYNYDLITFQSLWGMMYFLGYTAALILINSRWIKSKALGILGLSLAGLGLMYFLTVGLYDLSELRESYLGENYNEGFEAGIFHLLFRYPAFLLMTVVILVSYRYLRANYKKEVFTPALNLMLSITLLWVLSSELIHWLNLAGAGGIYKLWMTVFWGIYALALISLGIWKAQKQLRIAALVLFGITLIKLVFYDLANLNTLAKTGLFVLLGVLLLIISFLYNKFRGRLWEE